MVSAAAVMVRSLFGAAVPPLLVDLVLAVVSAAPATPGAADAPKDLSASTEDPAEVPSWQKTARDALGKYIASFAGSSGAVKAGGL
jgi:hypothetical protein